MTRELLKRWGQPTGREFAKPLVAGRAVDRVRIGVLPGEGVGPEVVGVAVRVLGALQEVWEIPLEVSFGGEIGLAADEGDGETLSEPVVAFCGDIFAAGGAILAGPGGGRFVYDLRRRFGLFCKLNPVHTLAGLAAHRQVSVLVVRENLGDLYQCQESVDQDGVTCAFRVERDHLEATLRVAVARAAARSGRLTLVVKEHGVPTVSRLWRDMAEEACLSAGVDLRPLDVDYACYQLLRAPEEFDVVVTSNAFGDILADLGGHLMGSRGLTYGASYTLEGGGVYQTNHGAAWDLAGTDRANPLGQVLSLAMLLRESFALEQPAAALERAVNDVLAEGVRTDDLRGPGAWALAAPDAETVVGTVEMGRRLCDKLRASRVPR